MSDDRELPPCGRVGGCDIFNLRTTELRAANEALQQFAYTASHDLREPLNKVISFGDRLSTKYGDRLDDDGRQYLEIMRNAAFRMRALVDDILVYARSDQEESPQTSCQLGVIAAEALSDLDCQIQDAKADISMGTLPTIKGHPRRMRQLLQNLISNAVKFRRPDVPCQVRIRGDVVDGWAVITIQDNGIGIDPQYFDKIFQAFTRLHTRFEYPGTGIGLAMCRKIVAFHGGTIEVQSEQGKGSTFTVRLPVSGRVSG